MFYSKQTGGFYNTEIHGEKIPSDAVEITKDYHGSLLEGQSFGNQIIADKNGFPVLVRRPVHTNEQIAFSARAERNSRLSDCDWTMLADAPLTVSQRESWQSYRQSLRDVPDQVGFPQNIVWPSSP